MVIALGDDQLHGQELRPALAEVDTLMLLLAPPGDSTVFKKPLSSIVNTIARKVQPSIFDSTRIPQSSIIGMLFDRSGALIHHSATTVADDNVLMLPFIQQLFPDTAIVESAAVQLFARLQGAHGPARHVDVIAVFLRDPRDFGIQ